MTDPMTNVRTLNIDGVEVVLDPRRLSFSDATLPKFMEEISLWFDYFSSKSAKAEEILANAETKHENAYLTRFIEGKREVGSDKAADAFAKTHPEVSKLQEEMNHAKSNVKQIKEYIRALDKAHQMAQNRGHMIRKEMDKLNADFYYQSANNPVEDFKTTAEQKLEEIFG